MRGNRVKDKWKLYYFCSSSVYVTLKLSLEPLGFEMHRPTYLWIFSNKIFGPPYSWI